MSEQTIQPAAENTGTKTFRRSGDMFRVPLSQVTIDEDFNVRGKNNFGDLVELAASLKEHGQKEAAFAVRRDGGVVLITGHRRFTAWHHLVKAKELTDEPEMLIRFVPPSTSLLDLYALQYTENIKVANTPYEQALLIQKMVELGATGEDIQKRLGISASKLAGLKKLLKMPEEVKSYVSTGKLSVTTANDLYRSVKGDAEAFKNEVKTAVEKAQAEGGKKATARHSEVAKTRTHAAILKAQIERLSAKEESGKISGNEAFALSLFKSVFEKNSDRTIADKIRDGLK